MSVCVRVCERVCVCVWEGGRVGGREERGGRVEKKIQYPSDARYNACLLAFYFSFDCTVLLHANKGN